MRQSDPANLNILSDSVTSLCRKKLFSSRDEQFSFQISLAAD
jgi:hypothetical protein